MPDDRYNGSDDEFAKRRAAARPTPPLAPAEREAWTEEAERLRVQVEHDKRTDAELDRLAELKERNKPPEVADATLIRRVKILHMTAPARGGRTGAMAVVIDSARCIRETAKALLVDTPAFAKQTWVPKSAVLEQSDIKKTGDTGCLAIADWMGALWGLPGGGTPPPPVGPPPGAAF